MMFLRKFLQIHANMGGLGLGLLMFASVTHGQILDYKSSLKLIDPSSIEKGIEQARSHGLEFLVSKLNLQSRSAYEDLIASKSDALLSLLRALHSGSLNPERLSRDIKFKKREFLTPEQFHSQVVRVQGSLPALIEALAPQHIHYQSLLKARADFLARCENLQSSQAKLLNFPKISYGSNGTVALELKKRFQIYGYLRAHSTDLVDEEFVRAINDVQANLKMEVDGSMSQTGKTIRYLMKSCQERKNQIDADLEKLRWLPSELEKRHIFVNTAFSSFQYNDETKQNPERIYFRAINGTFERMTPSMRDRITYLVFNPTWTIPPTVFIQDKVKLLSSMKPRQIQYYFDSNHYRVISSDFSSFLDPLSIDWRNIDPAEVDFYIQQKPNYLNSLGVVKFMMTNPYAIYLHDTNQRSLFKLNDRMKSSGCVRLEKPLLLAEILLRGTDWSAEKIQNHVVKPGEVLEQETRVTLKSPVPVYTIPVTSILSSDGVLRFTDDVYGHNALIFEKWSVP